MHATDGVSTRARADADLEAQRGADLFDDDRGKLRHVTNESLPQAGPSKLGAPTIMDPALAAQHGVAYVQLAAFAIDVDRVREHVEGYDDPRPFGWEVFLTEAYLLERFDPNRRPEEVVIFEDIVLGIIEGEPSAFGAQIIFAIWDLIERGRFPKRLEGAFSSWPSRPDELVAELTPLFEDEAAQRRELARACLDTELDPPLAPPTVAALRGMTD